MAETPAPAEPTPPVAPPAIPDPSIKRKRVRVLFGALVAATITIASAYNIDLCKPAAAFGWIPAGCSASK